MTGGRIVDDEGDIPIVYYLHCAHLDGKSWQVYYGDTTPDFLQEPTSNDKERGYTGVAGTHPAPVNEDNDVTEGVISWLTDVCNTSIINAVIISKKDIEDFIDKLKSGEYSVIRNVK